MGLKAVSRSSGSGSLTVGTTTISGGTTGRVLYDNAGVVGEASQLTINATAGQGPTITAGTATTDVAALSITRTNNNAAVATGVKWTFTDTASAAGFLPFQILGGAAGTTNLLSVSKAGAINVADGTKLAPSVAGSSSPGVGFYFTSGAIAKGNGTAADWLDFGSFIRNDSARVFAWSSGLPDATSNDTGLSRVSAGVVGVGTGAAGSVAGTIKTLAGQFADANGQMLVVQSLTELTTIAAAANTDTTIQMPANSVVLGVDVRVTTVIPTAATFTVGDSGSAARFSTTTVSTAAGSTDPGTKAGAYYNSTALSIRITPNAQPADNTGRVRVTIHYYSVTPATS